MNCDFKIVIATLNYEEAVWKLLQKAIVKRKNEGSNQWQDGYPNPEVIANDIAMHNAYIILSAQGSLMGYFALSFTVEPAYEKLKTGWQTQNQPYAVVHRLALTQQPKIMGLATWVCQQIEHLVIDEGIKSIKVDTNFDNAPMLHLFDKLGYVYAGEVYFRGSARRAFEKVLNV